MDDEYTADFREPCSLCSAVDWGISDEGRFYCRSCHNVIERTREVVDLTSAPGSSRISSLSRGRRRRRESLRQWMICEAFQFILRNQANALLRLGVSAHFKDQVLCPLWRRYLQSSRQAYTSHPVRTSAFHVRRPDSDSDTVAGTSASETDASSIADSGSDWSQCSGSQDGDSYRAAPERRTGLMSMRKTLALLHVALVWSREPLTLSDLRRLVSEGLVPFTNAYEELPEEMKLQGRDVVIFKVQSVPSHQALHREAQTLVQQLQLQSFPPISRQSLLHPALLSLRYLADANLPDELHPWLCRLTDRAGMADEALHTFDQACCPELPLYDVQAAALIIVTMKLVFGMDDHTEWDLSNEAGVRDDPEDVFHLRRWFRLTHAALTRARQTRRRRVARKQWKGKKPLCRNRKGKSVVMKQKRTADQVQACFQKLSCCPGDVRRCDLSSFRFCWGDGDGADGPSLHHQRLDGAVTLKHGVLTPSNSAYWHPVLRRCDAQRCRSHYSEVEATLPRSFIWLLQLFCFLLDVEAELLYEEVLRVERRVLPDRTARRIIRGGRRPGPGPGLGPEPGQDRVDETRGTR